MTSPARHLLVAAPFVAAVASLGAAAASCSNDPQGSIDTSYGEAGAVVPLGEGGILVFPDAGGGEGGAGTPDGGAKLGALAVVDVADTPCSAPGGTAIEIVGATSTPVLFDRMGRVDAAHRFLFASDPQKLLAFGTAGASPSPVLDGVQAACGEAAPGTLAAMIGSGTGTSFQRFATDGSPSGAATQLVAGGADARAIAAGSTKGLAVWTKGAAMGARLFDVGGAVAGTPIDLGSDAAATNAAYAAAVAVTDGFVVYWTRARPDGQTETSWRHVGLDGTPGAPSSVVLSTAHHVLVGAAAIGSDTMLLVDDATPSTVLVHVDAAGHVVAPAYRLLGVDHAFGLASHGGDVAVVGAKGRRAAMRALGTNGDALGPWVCVDDGATAGSTFQPSAAIDAEGAGWAIAAHESTGAVVYVTTDVAGNGF